MILGFDPVFNAATITKNGVDAVSEASSDFAALLLHNKRDDHVWRPASASSDDTEVHMSIPFPRPIRVARLGGWVCDSSTLMWLVADDHYAVDKALRLASQSEDIVTPSTVTVPDTYTIEFWARWREDPRNNSAFVYFGTSAFSTTETDWFIVSGPTGDLRFRVWRRTGSLQGNLETGIRANSGTWNHYALAIDDATRIATLAVDGNVVDTITALDALNASSVARLLFRGNCDLRSVRIWPTAKTPAELETVKGMILTGQENLLHLWPLNDGSTPAVDLVGGKDFTVTGGNWPYEPNPSPSFDALVPVWSKPDRRSFVIMDGANRARSAAVHSSTVDLTVELDFRISPQVASSTREILCAMGTTGLAADTEFSISHNNSDLEIRIARYTSFTTTNIAIVDDQRHQLTVRIDGAAAEMTWELDDSGISAPIAVSAFVIKTNTERLSVGAFPNGGNPSKADIYRFRVWRKLLTSADRAAFRHADVPGLEHPDLMVAIRFDDASGLVARDFSDNAEDFTIDADLWGEAETDEENAIRLPGGHTEAKPHTVLPMVPATGAAVQAKHLYLRIYADRDAFDGNDIELGMMDAYDGERPKAQDFGGASSNAGTAGINRTHFGGWQSTQGASWTSLSVTLGKLAEDVWQRLEPWLKRAQGRPVVAVEFPQADQVRLNATALYGDLKSWRRGVVGAVQESDGGTSVISADVTLTLDDLTGQNRN